MEHPHNPTELHMFIGCVNYYRDMWPSCAHILKPLTNQSSLKKKAPIQWIDEMQKAFNKMSLLMAADALAAYPDHNKRFDVYVTPHMVTNSFQEWGLPIWEFFCPPARSGTGTPPRMVMGIGVFAFP